MKYQNDFEKEQVQAFCFLLFLYGNKENYSLLNGNNFRIVTKNGKLLKEDFNLKRIFLMIVGIAGWKKMYSFVKKNSGPGGFLTHRGKKSCFFSIEYNLSLPFKMMSIEVKDEKSLVRYYLSMRKKKNEFFELIVDNFGELVEILTKIDNNLIIENKLCEEEEFVELNFRLFSSELFKTLSPILESYNRRHDKHFAMSKDIKKTEENIINISNEIRSLNERVLLLEEKLSKENTSWKKDIKYLASKLIECDISDEDQTKVKKILYKTLKKNKEPLMDRIPKSSICPWLRKDAIDNFF